MGALVPCRNQSKSVGPYDRPIDEAREMPSATCVLNIPLSYVWQPNDASTPMREPSLFPNQNLSRDMCRLIVEPSVYETPYAHALPSHERQCIPGGGFEHATFWFVELDLRPVAFGALPCLWSPQCEQLAHGKAVSAEPVSTIRSNDRLGVPTHTSAEK